MPFDAIDWKHTTIDDLLALVPPILQTKFESMDHPWKNNVARQMKRYIDACINTGVYPSEDGFIEILQNPCETDMPYNTGNWRNYGVKSFLMAYFRSKGQGIPKVLRGRHDAILKDLKKAGFNLTRSELSRYCWRLREKEERELRKFMQMHTGKSAQTVLDFYKLATDPSFRKLLRVMRPIMENLGLVPIRTAKK